MSLSTFTLSPEHFAQLFPFHILLDAQMCIVQAGSALQRLCPSMKAGQLLDVVCEIERPVLSNVNLTSIAELSQSLFLLNVRATRMRLKGQMLIVSQQIVFLGTPWITNLQEMEPLGLSLSDFALHDSLTDFLVLVQSKNAALADAQKLAQTLTRQREKLRRANQKLEAQYALTRILTAATTQEASTQILQTVCTATGWDVGVLWGVDRTEQVLRPLDQWHITGMDGVEEFKKLTEQAVFQWGDCLPGTAWAQGQAVWVDNLNPTYHPTEISTFSPREQAGRNTEFCCALAIPVSSNGDVQGVLEFYNRTPRLEEAEITDLVATLAHQIGQFLERKQAEETIWRQAYHDALTGLSNRSLFMKRLGYALAQEKETLPDDTYPAGLAVLFLDLDNFKFVNDSMGHEAGDTLLKTISARLQACARKQDTVARLGGDEFTLLLENLNCAEEACEVAQCIIMQLQQPVQLGEREVFVSASLGVAYCADRAEEAEILLRNADTAMYEAKVRGKSGYALFEPSMMAQVVERVEVETGLRFAVERNELRVYYQPLIDLELERMNGVEALVRWEHPIKGLILPGKFIAIAEETGMIVSIGYWVLEEACRQMQQWKKTHPHYDPLTINVNLSGKQLQRSDVVERIQATLIRTGLPPESLKLEITESVMMTDVGATVGKLMKLKTMGVKLAMDDFGTGYSSMASLNLFPLDTIKIDRSFIS